jgi:hypothetical protein
VVSLTSFTNRVNAEHVLPIPTASHNMNPRSSALEGWSICSERDAGVAGQFQSLRQSEPGSAHTLSHILAAAVNWVPVNG